MDIKKWLFRTNEDGYINRENEKLENILMIIFFAVILIIFIILIIYSFSQQFQETMPIKSYYIMHFLKCNN